MLPALSDTILDASDPAPIETVHGTSTAGLVLLCEHAGCEIPGSLGDLGIGLDVLDSHRGWDIGAGDVARGVADTLRAPLVMQHYSRLVIDCNRPVHHMQSIPEISDQRYIPGNRGLSMAERQSRIKAIFDPMNRQLDALFAVHPRKAVFSLHSFTPRMNGQDRPWHAGF